MNHWDAHGQVGADRSEREERLAAVLEELYECLERGERPDIEAFCAAHADLAEEIRECAASLSFLRTVELVSRPGGAVRELKPGERFGPYEILEELGRGGMGIVYRARHVLLDRPVALKVLVASSGFGTEARKRFFREARTAANLHHTNIVPIFDVGEVEGLCYYAMQLIHGCPLNHLIAALRDEKPLWSSSTLTIDDGRITPRGDKAVADTAHSAVGERQGEATARNGERCEQSLVACVKAHPELADGLGHAGYYRHVAGLIAQAARALAYAHRRGVVHRDIKPSNLLLDPDGVLWITDFGLAVHLPPEGLDGQSSASFELVGTPHYMSPEQVMPGTKKPDHRMDIYGLGATLYELVTLRPMVQGPNPLAILAAIVSETPPAPRKVNPRVPRDLDAIIRRATAKDPDHRYQSADELAEDLERFVRHEPIRARAIGPVGRLWRWCRRQPVLAATIAAATIAVLSIATVAYRNVQRERDQALAARRRAEAALQETQRARLKAQQRLWEALFQQARATLATKNAGRRSAALQLLQQAARMNFSPELRDVAVLALSLPDVRQHRATRLGGRITYVGFSDDGAEILVASREVEIGEGGRELVRTRILRGAVDSGRLTGAGMPAIDGFVGEVRLREDGTLLAVVREPRENPDQRGRWRAYTPVLYTSDGARFSLTWQEQDPAGVMIVPGGNKLVAWYRRSDQVVVFRIGETEVEPETIIDIGKAEGLALGPHQDSQISVLDEQGTLRVWNLRTGEQEPSPWSRPIATEGRRLLRWDPRGRLLAVGSNHGTVAVWSVDRDEPLYILSGHRGPITQVAFNATGDMIATASLAGLTLRISRASSGEELVSLRDLGAPASDVAFSPDGRWLLAASRIGRVVQWEVRPANVVREYNLISGPLRDAVYADQMQHLVVASQQRRIAIVDRSARQLLAEYDLPDGGRYGSRVARLTCAHAGGVCWQAIDGSVWQMSKDGQMQRLLPSARRVPFGGRCLLAGSDQNQYVRLTSRVVELWQFNGQKPRRLAEDRVRGLLVDATWHRGDLVVLAGVDRNSLIRRYRVKQGALEPVRSLMLPVNGLRIAALDDQTLLLGTWDGHLVAVNLDSGRVKSLSEGDGPVTQIAVAPQRTRFAVAFEDGTVQVWKTNPAIELAYRLPEGVVGPITSVRFSPDGRYLLLTGDNLAEWDLDELDRQLHQLTLLPALR